MNASEAESMGGQSVQPEFDHSEHDEWENIDEISETRRTDETELTKDEVFELLKNSRRRTIIDYLESNGGSATLSDLAEFIAAEENDIDIGELSSDQRKRVYIGLYQCHLPKMDNHGVVEYDKNRGTVELQDRVTELLPYMESEEEDDAETPHLELGIAIGVVAIVVVGTLGAGPFSAVPAVAWTLVSVAGIIAITLLQFIR